MKSSDAGFEFEPLDHAPVAVVAGGRATAAHASDMLAAARAEADQIRETARAEGFQAGYDAGMASAMDHLSLPAEALASAHAALGAERERAGDAAEEAAIELALALAEKALGAALEVRPEHVVDVVRGGLRRLLERDRVVVFVHPEDLEIVRASVDGLQSQLGGIGALDVQAERRVARGGAIVRTATAEVDGRLETQLERAREAMVEGLRAEAS